MMAEYGIPPEMDRTEGHLVSEFLEKKESGKEIPT